MPMIAAAAAAVFSAAVSYATAVGAATLATVGLASTSVGIAGMTAATLVGALQIGSTAMSLFSALKKPNAGGGGPSPIAWKADPNAFIPVVAGGPIGVGGNQVFAQVAGTKNRWIQFTTVLSHCGPCVSVTPFKANDETVMFTRDNGQGAEGRYKDRWWMKNALGAVGAAATLLTATGTKYVPPNPPEWTPQHKLSGMAHSVESLWGDTERLPQIPKHVWEVIGGPVYDARKDSTQPGGVGPQRWNDRTTWSTVGNTNPYNQALTFLIGHWFGGVRVAGVGLHISKIDVAAYMYGATVADANNWKIAWQWHTGMRKWDVLATMLQAGGGLPLVRQSKVSCMVEAPRVSIGTITDADLRGDFSVTGCSSIRDRKNSIIPRCRSKAHNWTVQPQGRVSPANYLAEDGGEDRPVEIEYESVVDPTQVRQLAALELANMREGLAAVLPVSPAFLKYRAGDCLTVNAGRTLMTGQKVVVVKREFDHKSRVVQLTVRSETDGKHAYAMGQLPLPPASPSLSAPDLTVIEPPTPGAWVVTPGEVPGGGVGGTSKVPLIVICPLEPTEAEGAGGALMDEPAATAVVVRYRKTGIDPNTGLPYEWAQETFPPRSDRLDVKGLAPGVQYEVEVAYVVRGITSAFTAMATITTGGLLATDSVAVGGTPSATVLANLAAAQQDIADLTVVYGSTVSAAASAAAAAASASTATTQAANAVIAQGAAAGSATAALSSATAAALSAGNALTSQNAAATSATAASGSATTAGGHASSASTSATAAANSATAAGNSATAAAGSATTASTQATNAGNSATAAAASAVSAASSFSAANLLAAMQLPDRYDGSAGQFFTFNVTGTPAGVVDYPSNATAAGYGPVREITTASGSNNIVAPRGVVPATPGRTYRVEAEFQRTALVGTPTATTYGRVELRALDAAYADVAGTGGMLAESAFTGTVQTGTGLLSDVASAGVKAWPAGSVWLRPYFRSYAGGATSITVQFRRLTITDVTEQQAALASATAAATSASAASTSAGAAGTSATAAQTSATNAATSAGAASTSATNASNSATNAAGSASTATTQAGLAANSATAAGGSATAANTSAGTAATHATNAGNSATAANASAVSAASSFTNTVIAGGNPAFDDGLTGWTGQADSTTALTAVQGAVQATYNTRRNVFVPASVLRQDAVTIKRWSIDTSRKYKIRTAFHIGAGATVSVLVGYLARDGAGAWLPGLYQYFYPVAGTYPTGTGWVDFTAPIITGEGAGSATVFPTGTKSIQLFAFLNSNNTAGAAPVGLDGIWLEDVTESAAAAASATAAAGSATTATTQATNAGTSATAAQTSATNANTSAGNANTSANAASASATTASGHASNASNSATAAAGSALAAGNSATAASGSANTASTQATNAGNSATAAASSATSASSSYDAARLAAAYMLPSTFAQDGATWFSGYQGSPETRTPLVGGGWTFPTVTGVGKVARVAATVNTDVATIGKVVVTPNRRYRATMRARRTDGAATARATVWTIGLDAAHNYVAGASASGGVTLATVNQWYEATQEMTAAQVLAAGADSLRPLGRVDSNTGVITTFEIQSIRLEDITESNAAATSATAANTSAQTASTQATAAGASATAASGHATTASTQAGLAGASATAAGTSAATASSAAAAASSSATVAASVGVRSLVKNPNFNDYPTTTGAPTQWTLGATTPIRTTGETGLYGMALSGGAGGDSYINAATLGGAITPQGHYVVEGMVRLDSGALTGSGILFRVLNTGASIVQDITIPFATDPANNTGAAIGAGTASRIYRFAKLVKVTAVTADRAQLFAMSHWSVLGSTAAANQLSWFLCSVRPATDQEIAAQAATTAVVGLTATTSSHAIAIADLESGYEEARLEFSANTSGGAARLRLASTTHGTIAGLDADQIYFGENTYFDDATDTLRTNFGATQRVTAWGAAFGVDGQLTEWEGPAAQSFATMARANAYFYRANTAPYVGGTALAGSGPSALIGTPSATTNQSTNGTTWTAWGAIAFAALPTGGYFELAVGIQPLAMTISNGANFFGNWRIRQGATVLLSGTFMADPGPSLDIVVPELPKASTASGATTLTFEVQRASGTNNITGGVDVYFNAKWTASG